MQTFGAGKWPSGSVGDLVGEYDGLGAPGNISGKTPHQGINATAFARGIVTVMVVH